MNNSFDVDQIVGHVKNIYDSSRCVICDNPDGLRLRYPCGHTSCDKCVTEECLLCLTPPQTSTQNKPVQDNVLIKRCQNAANLLESCQATFNIDVFKRQRLSEKLKLEKEIFPDCIQAPVKYCNKRKSLNASFANKSKRLSFLGEQVSLNDTKMEKSSNYVHAWLTKNEKSMPRKPLGDINVIQQQRNYPINKTRSKDDRVKENNTNKLNTSLKRTHKNFQTVNSPSCIDKYLKHANDTSTKRIRTELFTLERQNKKQNYDINDESGIVMDDEPIIIDDSQSQVVDKDKEAWLAVQEAEKKFQDNTITIERLDSTQNVKYPEIVESPQLRNNEKNHIKVPFYKKSYIVETCMLCSNDSNILKNNNRNSTQFKDNVSITIESNTFTTTIQVSNTKNSNKKCYQQSAFVQTDISFSDVSNIQENNKDSILIGRNDPKTILDANQSSPLSADLNDEINLSQNMFRDDEGTEKYNENENTALEEIGNVTNSFQESLNKSKCVVIDESDSDLESSGGGQVEVTAEIHRSCDQFDYGVLTQVVNQQKHASRKRRKARGYTPTSTDSSDKENFNPNRTMKTKFGKKYKK